MQQSERGAEEAERKIPDIEDQIRDAEEKTRDARFSLAGAESDAIMARDIAQEAQATAEMASNVSAGPLMYLWGLGYWLCLVSLTQYVNLRKFNLG